MPPPPSGSRGIIIDKNRFFLVHPLLIDQKLAISPFNLSVIKSPKQRFGDLLFLLRFLLLLLVYFTIETKQEIIKIF